MEDVMYENILNDMQEVENDNQDYFSKKQLYMSDRFSSYKDIINAIFENKRKYTLDEAYSLIQKFLKGDF